MCTDELDEASVQYVKFKADFKPGVALARDAWGEPSSSLRDLGEIGRADLEDVKPASLKLSMD